MASGSQDYRVHPDTLLWVVIGIIVCVVLYHFPPIKIKVYAIRAYLYSFESVLVLDFENAKAMKNAGDFLAKADVNEMKKISIKKVDEYFKNSFERIRFRIFIIFLIIGLFFVYLIRNLGKDKPSRKGKYTIEELLHRKYGFSTGGSLKDVESVYKRMMQIKAKRNLPVNLIARLYPKGSKERIYIYKGSYDYEIVSKRFTVTK